MFPKGCADYYELVRLQVKLGNTKLKETYEWANFGALGIDLDGDNADDMLAAGTYTVEAKIIWYQSVNREWTFRVLTDEVIPITYKSVVYNNNYIMQVVGQNDNSNNDNSNDDQNNDDSSDDTNDDSSNDDTDDN